MKKAAQTRAAFFGLTAGKTPGYLVLKVLATYSLN